MTSEEMEKVAVAAVGVDGDCPYCLAYVLSRLAADFPEHIDAIDRAWIIAGYMSYGWQMED